LQQNRTAFVIESETKRSKAQQSEAKQSRGNMRKRNVSMDLMNKQRTVIEFQIFESINSNEIARLILDVSGNDGYFRVTAFRLTKEVRAGNESQRDSGRPGRPSLWEIDDEIHSILKAFLSASIRHIEDT
jgi:hypothetical protein